MSEKQFSNRINNGVVFGSLDSEVAALRQKLESREQDFDNLSEIHQLTLNERLMMEEQLEAMKERVKEADDKLSEVRAESEAALRQNENDQQELAMMRRRSLVGGGGQIISQMYETILMRYEELKVSHEELQAKMSEEVEVRRDLENQLDTVRMQEQDPEKEALIRQNQILKESSDSVKKELVKCQKDLNRVREERTRVKREYNLVMSERDAVHKEMDKLQDDLNAKQAENDKLEVEKKSLHVESERLGAQIVKLQQTPVTSFDTGVLQEELYAAQQERKQALLEKEEKVHEAYTTQKAHALALEKIDALTKERQILSSKVELVQQQLDEAIEESRSTAKWRELAFSERDKLNCELEESRRVCFKLTEERELLIKQLETAVKERDLMKESKKSLQLKLHDIQSRSGVKSLESSENAHSHDSAIDSGNWENEPNERIICTLPKQYDVTLEPGVYVKHSDVPWLGVGDRVVAMDDGPIYNASVKELNDRLSRHLVVRIKLIKFNPVQRNGNSTGSSRDGLNKHPSDHILPIPPHEHPVEKNIWRGDNVEVRLRAKPQKQLYNGTPRSNTNSQQSEIQRKNAEQRESVVHNSEDTPQLIDLSAYSDSFYGFAKPNEMKSNTDNSSTSHSSGKKKKPKIGSSRFSWTRKKKTKSPAAGGVPPAGENSGGTWPRLDSPPLNSTPGGGGRLSVYVKKKDRPSISSITFTPPEGHSAGHTPPTPLRVPLAVSPGSPTSPLASSIHPPEVNGSPPVSPEKDTASSPPPPVPYHRPSSQSATKKKRPLSAPLGMRIFSMWQQPIIESNSNVIVPPTSPTQSGLPLIPPAPAIESIVSRPVHVPAKDIQLHNRTTSPTSPQSITTNRSTHSYKRQQSVPEHNKRTLTLPSTTYTSSLNASSASTSSNRSRNANSLPRPVGASKGPTMSVSCYGNKSKTLDCQRIRIPSKDSVGMKMSGSDIVSSTLSSDRSTPFLFSPFEHPSIHPSSARSTSHTESSVSSLSVASSTLSTRSRRPPVSNDPRYVTMVKGPEPIGISIVSGESGGIFVSRLNDHSLASKAGLEYGDQLLEYNGVNLRNAKEEQARVIMSQTQPGDNIKFLAQYNLEKYKQSIESNLSDTLGVSKPIHQNGELPCEDREERTITPDVTPRASPQVEDSLRAQRLSEPRYVFLSGGCSHIKLVGGNHVGVFVASVTSNDETLTDKPSDMKIGDQIIEFNSVSFVNITLEAASLLLMQSPSSASFYVKYEPIKFKQIYGIPGDNFFVRTLFDHMVDQPGALQFTRNSILLVENTYPDYVSGQWTASLVDEQGERSTRGRIPSKVTVEKERENSSHLLDDVTSTTGSSSGKRLSGSGRRSFFKRLKPHRTSSRSSGDIRLHKSPSENSLESTVEMANESVGGYQVVEKHSSISKRPVVVFGAHSSLVVEKLTREHTNQFVKCCLTGKMNSSHDVIDTYTHPNDTRVLTGEILRETIQQFPQRHVLLEVSVEAIDRLYSKEIYPIIAFVKYASAKKIKESQERMAGREKVSLKQCKEILERQTTIEQTLLSKYYGAVTINGGPASTVAMKISKVVAHEHVKVLWLPSKSNLLNY